MLYIRFESSLLLKDCEMKRCCSCLREFGEFLAMTQGGLGWQQKWCCFLSKGLSDELKMLCQCGFLVITNWTSY